MQIEDGTCWRCKTPVENRILPQWFVATSRYAGRLRADVDRLDEWGPAAKRLLLRGVTSPRTGAAADNANGDWQVSRQRAWGTPIPMVHCNRCGIVPASDLPVCLPDHLDWSRGSAALRQCTIFLHTQCPSCGAPATREADTLDCFFDDAWSYLSCAASLDSLTEFPATKLAAWMPVDHFHSGFDTFSYLNLYRFIGAFLHGVEMIGGPEPIRRYLGHDMVTSGGRKMSKHLGNTVMPDEIMAEFGADALRIAVLWAAGPERSIDWRNANLQRAAGLLDRLFVLVAKSADAIAAAAGRHSPCKSKAAVKMESSVRESCRQVGQFIEGYRPNAAVEELANCTQRLESFVNPRAAASRLSADDALVLKRVLQWLAVALSPFAPYLAEEIAIRSDLKSMAATAEWPRASD
jgi:leucyl-tRNA synthetase